MREEGEDSGEEGTVEDLVPDPQGDPAAEVGADAGADAEGQAEGAAKSTLDELLANNPDWLKAQLGALESSGEITAQDIAELDHNAQRVLAGVLKRAQEGKPAEDAKAQALAQKEQEVAARERLLLHRQANNLRLINNDKARALLASLKPEGEAPDPFTDEGVEYRVRQQVAAQMEKFLGVFAESEQELQAAYAAAQAEAEAQSKLEADTAYIEEHLDTFSDPRVADRVVELATKHAFTVEQAHAIALREIVETDTAAVRQRAVELSRNRVTRGGRVGEVIPPTPSSSFAARQAHYERYPQAKTRDFIAAFGRPPTADEL